MFSLYNAKQTCSVLFNALHNLHFLHQLAVLLSHTGSLTPSCRVPWQQLLIYTLLLPAVSRPGFHVTLFLSIIFILLLMRGPAQQNISLQHHQWSKTPQSTFKSDLTVNGNLKIKLTSLSIFLYLLCGYSRSLICDIDFTITKF